MLEVNGVVQKQFLNNLLNLKGDFLDKQLVNLSKDIQLKILAFDKVIKNCSILYNFHKNKLISNIVFSNNKLDYHKKLSGSVGYLIEINLKDISGYFSQREIDLDDIDFEDHALKIYKLLKDAITEKVIEEFIEKINSEFLNGDITFDDVNNGYYPIEFLSGVVSDEYDYSSINKYLVDCSLNYLLRFSRRLNKINQLYLDTSSLWPILYQVDFNDEILIAINLLNKSKDCKYYYDSTKTTEFEEFKKSLSDRINNSNKYMVLDNDVMDILCKLLELVEKAKPCDNSSKFSDFMHYII